MKIAPGLFGVGVQTYDEPINKTQFLQGQPAAPNPNPEPVAPSAPKDTISMEEFMKGSEAK